MSFSDRLERARGGSTPAAAAPAQDRSAKPSSAAAARRAELKRRIQTEIIDQVNDPSNEGADLHDVIRNTVATNAPELSRMERNRLVQEVYDEVAGLGPLEALMADPSISEVMVNGPKQIYIERAGKIELSNVLFDDDAHVMRVIDRIVSNVGRRCDESSPMVDARLADGSRVNVVIPPISLVGPSITIRRFSSRPLQIGDLIEKGSLSYSMASFLKACVEGRANMIVSGGTGSGKTTLLNVLSGFIPASERIVTIEDAAELRLAQEHVVSMESRPANIEGTGAITIRDLVRNSLRMRPDRIIVGEVRSGETLDMLQAMNTGHEGSLTTVHANTPRDVISRLETMVLMSGMDLPVRAIRDQVSSAIDIIVHQARFRDGSRKIIAVSEVLNMEGDVITLQDIFTFKPEGLDANGKVKGRFAPTGIRPKIVEKLKENGVMVSDDWFRDSARGAL